jgi:hypothetical protein
MSAVMSSLGQYMPQSAGMTALLGTVLLTGIGKVTHQLKIDEKINTIVAPKFEELGKFFGRCCTLNFSSWEVTKPFWNSTVEPIVILVIKLPITFINGIVKGLLSDNVA